MLTNVGRCRWRGGASRSLMLVLMLGLAVETTRAAPDAATLESQVKAAFVLNFVQFVEWPEGAFAKAEDPIVIGVVGSETMAPALKTVVEGKTFKGRKIDVRSFAPDKVGTCHVLVTGSGAASAEMVKSAGGTATLTIGDAEDFTEAGGVIRFYLEERKVRFEINLAAAGRAHLQISAKLLKLAKVVNK